VKSNSLLLGMACLLAAFAVGITILSYWWVQLSRELGRAQVTIAQVEFQQNRFKALVSEAVEYSRRDASMGTLLQSMGLKPTQGASPAPANR
jgi:hypothetical protein